VQVQRCSGLFRAGGGAITHGLHASLTLLFFILARLIATVLRHLLVLIAKQAIFAARLHHNYPPPRRARFAGHETQPGHTPAFMGSVLCFVRGLGTSLALDKDRLTAMPRRASRLVNHHAPLPPNLVCGSF